MKQVLATSGGVVVEEVPEPIVEPGTVLVRVSYSCISVGTELSGISQAEVPIWKKALRNPDKVRKVLQLAATEGVARTREMVKGKVDAGSPLGYSASGVVLAVGEGIVDIEVGDRVACAGAGIANHAEVVRVPRNLLVRVPGELDLADASAVTLGAIALQGVRRATPTLGETFVVIGLGILGQMTVQMLKANGCQVVVVDLSAERLELAKTLGADVVAHADAGEVIEQVARVTDGLGADGVIITAATPSDEVVSTAFQMCRRKGRVVLVGDVGLDLDRADIYQKELDFLVSTSYGPGRYDKGYEEEGLDYPVGYVRWTENRNMGEVLRMMADGRLRLQPLVEAVYPITDAPGAYAALQDPANRPLMVLLEYPTTAGEVRSTRLQVGQPRRTDGKVKLALVGGGSFARGMHLPNLRGLDDTYDLHAVVSAGRARGPRRSPGSSAPATRRPMWPTCSATPTSTPSSSRPGTTRTRSLVAGLPARRQARAGREAADAGPRGPGRDRGVLRLCGRRRAGAPDRLQPTLLAVRAAHRGPDLRGGASRSTSATG